MGLRAFLQDIKSVGDLGTGAANQVQQLLDARQARQKIAAEQALQQRLQGLGGQLSSGELSTQELAGGLLEGGQIGPALNALKLGQTQSAKPGKEPITIEQLKGLDPDNLVDLDFKQSLAEAKTPADEARRLLQQEKRQAQDLNKFDITTSRLEKDKKRAARSQISDKINQETRKLRENIDQIDKFLKIGDINFKGAQRVLVTGILKTIGSDVGNVAVQEAEQVVAKTYRQGFREFLNKFTEDPSITVPPQFIDGMKKMFEVTKRELVKQNRRKAAEILSPLVSERSDVLKTKNGEIDPAVKAQLLRFGLEGKFEKDGTFSAKIPEVKPLEGNEREKAFTRLEELAAKIPDDVTRNAILQNIRRKKEGDLSKKAFENAEKAILDKIKGNK